MNGRPTLRTGAACLFAIVIAGLFQALGAVAQTPQPVPAAAVADVQQTVTNARKDIEHYTSLVGDAGARVDAEHPAVKWSAALSQVHDRAPRSDAGTLAAVECVRLLMDAKLWDRAHARVETLDADDPAWERVPSTLYEEGIARKDFAYTLATLSRTATSTRIPSIKSAALIVIGRVHRRQGDLSAATRAFEAARAAAPGTPQAGEADDLIYEVAHLSVGLPAPPISGPHATAGARSVSTRTGAGRSCSSSGPVLDGSAWGRFL